MTEEAPAEVGLVIRNDITLQSLACDLVTTTVVKPLLASPVKGDHFVTNPTVPKISDNMRLCQTNADHSNSNFTIFNNSL